MDASATETEMLRTTDEDFPLQEFRLARWSILHTNALLSREDEAEFLMEYKHRIPYGAALWPSAIALAQDVATRGDALRGRSVLELGAGTGLPGIIAASLGARVVQTDAHEVPMSLCRRNGQRNGAQGIEYRLVDWAQWTDEARYDWIIGSDILYGDTTHPHLRRIFENNLAPGGRILISDPFRARSLRLLEAMEGDGWKLMMTTWSIGEGENRRVIGLFELEPPT